MYKDYHVQVSIFRSSVMVHLRVKDRETDRFTTTGIALTEGEWRMLEDVWARIDENLQDNTLPPFSMELGDRGRRVTVRRFQDRSFVDIRSYFIPRDAGEPRPTRRGATLNLEAWRLLHDFQPLVRRDMRAATIQIAEEGVAAREMTRDRLRVEARLLRYREEEQERALKEASGEPCTSGVGRKRAHEETMATEDDTATTTEVSAPAPGTTTRRSLSLRRGCRLKISMNTDAATSEALDTRRDEDMDCTEGEEEEEEKEAPASMADTQPLPDYE